MEAAAFIVHWYQLTTVAPHPGGVVDQNGTFSTRGEENFDPEKALLSMLNNEVSANLNQNFFRVSK